jgi:hypothetical protein
VKCEVKGTEWLFEVALSASLLQSKSCLPWRVSATKRIVPRKSEIRADGVPLARREGSSPMTNADQPPVFGFGIWSFVGHWSLGIARVAKCASSMNEPATHGVRTARQAVMADRME